MEEYQVFMTKSATSDLLSISSYIAYDLQEPSIAKRMVEKIKRSVMNLTKLPLRHNLVSDENLAAQGFRKIIIDNYLIFYIVSEKEKTVTIMRILYGKRDWIHLL